MTQSNLLRSTSLVLSALFVMASWMSVVTVPAATHTIVIAPLA